MPSSGIITRITIFSKSDPSACLLSCPFFSIRTSQEREAGWRSNFLLTNGRAVGGGRGNFVTFTHNPSASGRGILFLSWHNKIVYVKSRRLDLSIVWCATLQKFSAANGLIERPSSILTFFPMNGPPGNFPHAEKQTSEIRLIFRARLSTSPGEANLQSSKKLKMSDVANLKLDAIDIVQYCMFNATFFQNASQKGKLIGGGGSGGLERERAGECIKL